MTTPYSDSALALFRAGYSPIPLPSGEKWPPPTGWTGYGKALPSWPDCQRWMDEDPHRNIAASLPRNVVGIDVDAWKAGGAESFQKLQDAHGQLPPTVRVSSRYGTDYDGVSGIRLFRIPDHLAALADDQSAGWRDGWPKVDLLRWGHRYVVAPPSTHPEGGTYMVRDERTGEEGIELPPVDELPMLPECWCQALFNAVGEDGKPQRERLDSPASIWWTEGQPCRSVQATMGKALDELKVGRHDSASSNVFALTRLGEQGHEGVRRAIDTLHGAFILAATTPGKGQRTTTTAEDEWGRMVKKLDAKIALDPTAEHDKGCCGSLSVDVAQDADTTQHYRHHNMSDAHLGERVALFHLQGQFLTWGRNGWSRWTGKCWETATETTVRRHVRDALMAIHAAESAKADADRAKAIAEAGVEPDPQKAKALADQATRTHAEKMRALASLFNVGKVDAVTKVARGFIECKLTDFDNQPDLLNVGNGVVALRTGELLPHHPGLLLTKITQVDYVPGATHPDWNTALEAIPEDVRGWMQVRFGQGATGHPPEDDKVPFLRGGGANGKSTILVGVSKALGEHSVLVPDKAILGSPNDHPTELMTLKGARLAFLEELPEGDFLDINRLKKITGSAAITARLIGENNVTFEPTHSLMVTTNYAVQVKATDHGTWRRLTLVMFPYTFGGPKATHNPDPGLKPRIQSDPRVHEAVLAWIIAGAKEWYNNGRIMPTTPPSVTSDTAEWQHASNDAARFLSARLELDPCSCVLTSDVYTGFKDWLASAGKKVMTDVTFWERAAGHEWFTTSAVEKVNVRTAGWTVSRHGFNQSVVPPIRARVLTGVRWKNAPEEGE